VGTPGCLVFMGNVGEELLFTYTIYFGVASKGIGIRLTLSGSSVISFGGGGMELG